MWRLSTLFTVSTHAVHTLINVEGVSCIVAYPEFIQLMDEDIVSLTGLTMIINPSCRDQPLHVSLSQLNLSLYLMAQCQMKLRHSVTSLAQTFNYVEAARRQRTRYTLDQLLLKLTERKVLLYVRASVDGTRS